MWNKSCRPRLLCAYCAKPTKFASRSCLAGHMIKIGPNADVLHEAHDFSRHSVACSSCPTGRSCFCGRCSEGICSVSSVSNRSELLRICQGSLPEWSKCFKGKERKVWAKGMSCLQGCCAKIGNAVVKNASARKCFPTFQKMLSLHSEVSVPLGYLREGM